MVFEEVERVSYKMHVDFGLIWAKEHWFVLN